MAKLKTHKNLIACKTCQSLGIVKIGHKPGTPCPNKGKLNKANSATLIMPKSFTREGFNQNPEAKTVNDVYGAFSLANQGVGRYEREVPQELSSRFEVDFAEEFSGKIFFKNKKGEWEDLDESEEGKLLAKKYNSVKTKNCEVWFNEEGKPDRKGKPALIWTDGTVEYLSNGLFDNRIGPARILPNGDEEYYVDGVLDCASGPAVRYADGGKMFFKKGKLGNARGPAVDLADGTKEWYMDDVKSDNPELCDFIANGPRLSLDEARNYVKHPDYVVRRLIKFHYGRQYDVIAWANID